MKKNQVNEKFIVETNRKKIIIFISCLIFIMFIISLSFLLLYTYKNKDYYTSYDEESFIDYKVYLKENEFFEMDYCGYHFKALEIENKIFKTISVIRNVEETVTEDENTTAETIKFVEESDK